MMSDNPKTLATTTAGPSGCLPRLVMPSVAVLFARRDSIYKTLPECDVWDADRDALNWPGGMPVIAHPPCRSWSQLRHFAKPREGEQELALWAVKKVRAFGGVLEHPAKSALWPAVGLPEPGYRDSAEGWTLCVPQQWWGHPCEKMTRFYIVGCDPKDIPPIPFELGEARMVQSYSHKCRRRPQMPHKLREHTPPALGRWLVELATRCKPYWHNV